MSTLKLPEIINISKASKTKSKNFILHCTKAQWKKSISKLKEYSGKKPFEKLAGSFAEFVSINSSNDGIIKVYYQDKKGKRKDLFPKNTFQSENGNIIIFLRKGHTIGEPCGMIYTDGEFKCVGGCTRGEKCAGMRSMKVDNGERLIGCKCAALARY